MMMIMMVIIMTTTRGARAYEGDGTFYGAGGNGIHGACMLQPGFNGIDTTVAINHEQFEGGAACGRCLRVTGSGTGAGMTPILGPIYATIDNECPECKHGDIDFGLSGDGRWNIQWDFISCNEVPHRSLRGSRGGYLASLKKKLKQQGWWFW